jgi:hypothetical protein
MYKEDLQIMEHLSFNILYKQVLLIDFLISYKFNKTRYLLILILTKQQTKP